MWKFWEQIGTMKIITNVFFVFVFLFQVSSLRRMERGIKQSYTEKMTCLQ